MQTSMPKPANIHRAFPYATVLAVLIALAIIVWAASVVPRLVARPTQVFAVTMQERAWYACAAHIAEQYQLSFLAAQRYTSSAVTTISSDTYQASITYPKQGRTVLCTIQRTAEGTWQLLDLR